MAAYQAPPSLGFSRQGHWSGLPFPSPMCESEKWKWSCSVVSDSSPPLGLQPTRLLHPWYFPGKSTAWMQNPALPRVSSAALGTFLLLSVPQFPHLGDGLNSSIHFIRLLWWSQESMHLTHAAWYLMCDKHRTRGWYWCFHPPRHTEKGLELVGMADSGRVGIQPTGSLTSKSTFLTTSRGFHSKCHLWRIDIEILQGAC